MSRSQERAEKISTLEVLGLSGDEQLVYEALVDDPGATDQYIGES